MVPALCALICFVAVVILGVKMSMPPKEKAPLNSAVQRWNDQHQPQEDDHEEA